MLIEKWWRLRDVNGVKYVLCFRHRSDLPGCLPVSLLYKTHFEWATPSAHTHNQPIVTIFGTPIPLKCKCKRPVAT